MKLFNALRDMSDEDIEKLATNLYGELEKRNAAKEKKKQLALKINGITVRDFSVVYADYYCSPHEPEYKPTFSFYLKRGKKEYCIYNDFCETNPHKWWPAEKQTQYGNRGWANRATEFIPQGFAEACENSYEFSGTTEEAIARLKEYGFTDIKDGQAETGMV